MNFFFLTVQKLFYKYMCIGVKACTYDYIQLSCLVPEEARRGLGSPGTEQMVRSCYVGAGN